MFKNKKCIIIGSGASIRENQWGIDPHNLYVWDKIKDCFTIGINWSKNYFDSTITIFSDYQFYYTEKESLEKLPLVLSIQNPDYGRVYGKRWKEFFKLDKNIYLLPPSNKYQGKDSWKEGFYTTRLSGLFATTLAINLGFKEIFLLGMDNCATQGRTHFYEGDKGVGVTIKPSNPKSTHTGVGFNTRGHYNTSHYQNSDLNDWWKPYLNEDVKIYNVSTNSKINVFQKIPYSVFYTVINDEKINQEESRIYIKSLLNKYYN